MFSAAHLFGSIIFSSIGIGGFSYGRKAGTLAPIWLGGLLMVYPYFVTQAWALYGVGIVLTGLMVHYRDA